MDTPPVETIVSSVASHEDADAKKTAAASVPDEIKESSIPAVTRPPHASPDLSFASEVTSQHADRRWQIQETGHG